ncbi:retrotransposon protein, putative, ty1-copia subclass [Tanacetum coccineum]
MVSEKTRYAVSSKVDTAYWAGFLRVRATVCGQHGYAVLGICQTRFLVKSWRRYAISLKLDTAYWLLIAGNSASMRKSYSLDDMLLIGNDIPTLQSVKDWFGKCFTMKDLGDAAYILGIKIYRDRSKRLIGLSQDTYLDKILKRFKMENSKKGNLPLHHGIKISKDLCPKTDEELDRMSRVPYASAVGSIMYTMTCTRLDVSFL